MASDSCSKRKIQRCSVHDVSINLGDTVNLDNFGENEDYHIKADAPIQESEEISRKKGKCVQGIQSLKTAFLEEAGKLQIFRKSEKTSKRREERRGEADEHTNFARAFRQSFEKRVFRFDSLPAIVITQVRRGDERGKYLVHWFLAA